MKLIADNPWWANAIDLFGRPAVAMLAWGAFLHMEHLYSLWGHSLYIGFWGFFLLNIVAMILTSSPIIRWKKEN